MGTLCHLTSSWVALEPGGVLTGSQQIGLIETHLGPKSVQITDHKRLSITQGVWVQARPLLEMQGHASTQVYKEGGVF